MLDTIQVLQHNLLIVDFSQIYKNTIETTLLNDLHTYDLLRRHNQNVKQIFNYHLIYGACESNLMRKGANRLIFFFNFNELIDTEVVKYYDRDKLRQIFYQFIMNITRLLPINFYISSVIDFDQLKSDYTDDTVDIFYNMVQITEKTKTKQFTLEKILKFTKKHKLTFLNADYFSQIKAKMLLIT